MILKLIQADPEYRTQMEIYFHWKGLERILNEHNDPFALSTLKWFARLLVNMIVGYDSQITESIWYALSVNYFECGMDGYWLLPLMYKMLPEDEVIELIGRSSSIDWEGKVGTYRAAISNQEFHEPLADALYKGCQAYCVGSIKPSEALSILNQLTISEYQKNLTTRILSSPVEVKVIEGVQLPEKTEEGIECFVAIEGSVPTWFPFAEFWIDEHRVGSIEHAYFGSKWESVASKYNFPIPENEGKIIGLKLPFSDKWLGEKALLKPE